MPIQIGGSSASGGGGYKHVTVTDQGRLNVLAATQEDALAACLNGNAYNVNTGIITGLSTADSAILYYKHLEDYPLVVETIIVGLNDADSNNQQMAKIIRNPTSGTIVSGASVGDMNQNRNFDSGESLSNSTFYKGADGNTFTDGSDYILFYAGENGRSAIGVNTVLKKGNSIGITLSPALASGTISAYAAMICHLELL